MGGHPRGAAAGVALRDLVRACANGIVVKSNLGPSSQVVGEWLSMTGFFCEISIVNPVLRCIYPIGARGWKEDSMSNLDYYLFEDFSGAALPGPTFTTPGPIVAGDPWSFMNQASLQNGALYLPAVYTDVRSRGYLHFDEPLSDIEINFDGYYHKASSNFVGETVRLEFTTADGDPISADFRLLLSEYGADFGINTENYNRPRLSIFQFGQALESEYDLTSYTSDYLDVWSSYTVSFDGAPVRSMWILTRMEAPTCRCQTLSWWAPA